MMNESFKIKAKEELRKLSISFLYLALFFCSFVFYTNLFAAEHSLSAFHYGFAILEALVIAKVIWLGQLLHLGERGLSEFSLMIRTLYKAMVFSLLVGGFSVVEHYLAGFIHGKDLAQINHEFVTIGIDVIFARTLIKFLALIPFFAFLELDLALGEGKLFQLFFRKGKGSRKL